MEAAEQKAPQLKHTVVTLLSKQMALGCEYTQRKRVILTNTLLNIICIVSGRRDLVRNLVELFVPVMLARPSRTRGLSPPTLYLTLSYI